MARKDTWKHIALAAVIVAGSMVKEIDLGAYFPEAQQEAEACTSCLQEAPPVEAMPLRDPAYL